MMIGREIIFAAIITGLAASFFLDIFGLASRLPNFRLKENPMNTNREQERRLLMGVLDDMRLLGLVELESDKSKEPHKKTPAIEEKPQAEVELTRVIQ